VAFGVSGAWNDFGRIRLIELCLRRITFSKLVFASSSEFLRLPEPRLCGERPSEAKHSVDTVFKLSCDPSLPDATRLWYSFSICFCRGLGGTGFEGGSANAFSVPWSRWVDKRGGGVNGAGDNGFE